MFRRSVFATLIVMVLLTSSASAATSVVKMYTYGFYPKLRTVTIGNSVKWKNVSGKRHTATPTVTWSWGGVSVAPGSASYAVTPTQAGSFLYFCSRHPTRMKGTLNVAITVDPLAGNTGTFFTLKLGTVKTTGVLIHEVEVRLNGGGWQLRATTQQPTISIFFPTPGTWDIHTRLRYQLGGGTSGWSPNVSIVVF